MFKMNRKVEYALMALQYIRNKNHQELTTAREICDKYNTPFDTTAKVMQQMHHAGILNSIKGIKGGYQLSLDLKTISLLKLSELIEEKNLSMDCIHGDCDLLNSCNIASPIKKLNHYVNSFFETLSVEDLLSDDGLMHLKTESVL
jgi:Rrf2 family protein